MKKSKIAGSKYVHTAKIVDVYYQIDLQKVCTYLLIGGVIFPLGN